MSRSAALSLASSSPRIVYRKAHVLPRDLISSAHACINSWTSSAATSLRDHDSSHFGFAGATGAFTVWLFPFAPPSLLKTLEKKGMTNRRME
jgi:hypothetical protein